MLRKVPWLSSMVALIAAMLIASCGAPTTDAAAADVEAKGANVRTDDLNAVLKKHVDDSGMVDYKALKSDSKKLDAYLASVAAFDPTVYASWPDAKKKAFWMNAYNAITLKSILNKYPIKAGLLRGLAFPKNSIRQIAGVWDKTQWTVMGRAMTLNDIEHKTLRADFDEPRIHAALVCAAMGCPPLRDEAYAADRLEEQLDEQMRDFLTNPLKFKIDRTSNTVYLSSIFEWYGEDFVTSFGTDTKYKGHSDIERAVLNAIRLHLSEVDRAYLDSASFSIDYLDYDWSLNEQ